MNRIKELRKQKNITAKELADMLGISQSMLTNYENGSSTPRDNSIWEKLSEYFGVTVSYLMGLTDSVGMKNAKPGGMFLPFIVIDDELVQKEYIEEGKPLEVIVSSVAEYALLANVSQLDDDDIESILVSVQELIREKYDGRCAEIRMSSQHIDE